MSIRTKLILFAIAVVVTAGILHIVLSVVSIRNQALRDVERLQVEERKKVEQELKERVTTINDIMESMYKDGISTSGNPADTTDLLSFINHVHAYVNHIRYDNGTGYIWINDMQHPYPVMIMHPTLPHLNGTVLDDTSFNCALGEEKNFFVAMRDVCEKEGAGFVDYRWPKPSGDTLIRDVPKLSYVTLFKPYNWVVGSGKYLDDIHTAVMSRTDEMNERISRLIQRSVTLSVIVIFAAVVIIFIFAGKITAPLLELTRMVESMTGKDIDLSKRITVTGSHEIVQLGTSFNQMANQIELTWQKLRQKSTEIEAAYNKIKENQLALTESEEKYRNIFESFQDVYYQTDLQGNLLIISPSFYRDYGYRPDEVIGHNVREYYLDPGQRDVLEALLKEHGLVWDYEIVLMSKEQKKIWCSINAKIFLSRD